MSQRFARILSLDEQDDSPTHGARASHRAFRSPKVTSLQLAIDYLRVDGQKIGESAANASENG